MKPRDGPAANIMEANMPSKPRSAQLFTQDQPSDPMPSLRRPTHRLYRVTGEGKEATWTPIGAAWPNKDGKGFNLSCDAVPLTGRIVLRLISPRHEPEAFGGQQ